MEVYDVILRIVDPTPLTLDEARAQLEACRVDPAGFVDIKHPLYVGIAYENFDPEQLAALPEEFREMIDIPKRLVAKHAHLHARFAATDEGGGWIAPLVLVERMYRPDVVWALLETHPIDDVEEARALLHDLWLDTEFPSGNGAWQALWEELGEVAELPFGDMLDELDDVVEVWRGFSGDPEYDEGLSWTTDRAKAEWFARRFASLHGEAHVWRGVVDRDDIWLATNERGEHEVVSDRVEALECIELELEEAER